MSSAFGLKPPPKQCWAFEPGADPEACEACGRSDLGHHSVSNPVPCTKFFDSGYQDEYVVTIGTKDQLLSDAVCGACGYPFRFHNNPWAKPESCRQCGLFKEPGPVPAAGPAEALMAFWGEGPGAEEVNEPRRRRELFQPFVGGSGKLLTRLCVQAGVNRRAVRVVNTVRCRPPENRLPTPNEIATCWEAFNREEFSRGSQNVYVALGDTAFRLLAPGHVEGIGTWRGQALEGQAGKKVFATWHPAFVMRAGHNWAFAVHDLARAQAQSAYPEIRRRAYEIIRTPSVGVDGQRLLERARQRGYACFDFETGGLDPRTDPILMVGLTEGPDTAHVYDWTRSSQQLLQTVFDDPAIEVVGQNILYFDYPYAEAKGVDLSKTWLKTFDTMVAFHLCNSSYGQTPISEQRAGTFRSRGPEKDLTMIASVHTDIPYWKSKAAYKNDLRGVCGLDVIATDRAATDEAYGLKAELKSYDMLDLYYKHVLPVHPIIHRMTQRGVRINVERAASWSALLTQEADRMEAELKQGLGAPWLNLASPQQLMKLLYEDMKLPVQMIKDKKKGWRPTANAEAIDKLAESFPEHALLKQLVGIRHFRKMESTYVREPAQAGRVHPRFGVSKAATGRFNAWGPNAQNVPEELRDIWITDDDDCVFISADWSQIEWRLAMVLSGDPVGLELLASGVDNHSAVAAETLGKRIGTNDNGTCDHVDCLEHVTDKERYRSKFIVYGLGYGRGSDSIVRANPGWSKAFVDNFIASFMHRFKTFAQWREHNVATVKAQNYLANAFKRRRWWYTWEITEVYNYPQQSNAADQMYDALIELDPQLPPGWTLRLTVHDEIVAHGPKYNVKEAVACIRTVMQRTWPQIVEASWRPEAVKKHYPQGWHVPVDIGVGTDWEMCKSKSPKKKAERSALMKHLGLSA